MLLVSVIFIVDELGISVRPADCTSHTVVFPAVSVHVPDPISIFLAVEILLTNVCAVTLKLFALKLPDPCVKLFATFNASCIVVVDPNALNVTGTEKDTPDDVIVGDPLPSIDNPVVPEVVNPETSVNEPNSDVLDANEMVGELSTPVKLTSIPILPTSILS